LDAQSQSGLPFNYRYLVDYCVREGGGRILDYGCGEGQTISLGLSRGLDIWGAEIFPSANARVVLIENGRAGFPDGHFDMVICNQVLEHVAEPSQVLADSFRLLRPDGVFLAAFPVRETWWEAHVGLYFGHRFAKGSRWRRQYFTICHRLGFGLDRVNSTSLQWAVEAERMLDAHCFYRSRAYLWPMIATIFGSAIEDISAQYMRARLGAYTLPAKADPLLRLIYHVRGGEIIRTTKRA
jgi:SAM-dependent methyltransferase